jgi:hypothetical protein
MLTVGDPHHAGLAPGFDREGRWSSRVAQLRPSAAGVLVTFRMRDTAAKWKLSHDGRSIAVSRVSSWTHRVGGGTDVRRHRGNAAGVSAVTGGPPVSRRRRPTGHRRRDPRVRQPSRGSVGRRRDPAPVIVQGAAGGGSSGEPGAASFGARGSSPAAAHAAWRTRYARSRVSTATALRRSRLTRGQLADDRSGRRRGCGRPPCCGAERPTATCRRGGARRASPRDRDA